MLVVFLVFFQVGIASTENNIEELEKFGQQKETVFGIDDQQNEKAEGKNLSLENNALNSNETRNLQSNVIHLKKLMFEEGNFIIVKLDTDKEKYRVGEDINIKISAQTFNSPDGGNGVDFNLKLITAGGSEIGLCDPDLCNNWNLTMAPGNYIEKTKIYSVESSLKEGIYSLRFETRPLTKSDNREIVVSDNVSQKALLIVRESKNTLSIPDNNIFTAFLSVLVILGLLLYRVRK